MSASGFEPETVCLEGRCSIQLSYAPICNFEKITKTVGAAGFEPATSWSQTRRDDRTTLRPELVFAAESKGFEPLVPLPVRMFSKHVLSASQATLLNNVFESLLFRYCECKYRIDFFIYQIIFRKKLCIFEGIIG